MALCVKNLIVISVESNQEEFMKFEKDDNLVRVIISDVLKMMR